ncbi:alpha/beta hydrolase family protein [Streptomyces sp. N2-109]|uniref:Alpha/beta hydrolase family protein n=1 Tax=Streptomyces gossypii TaxID=2883101 RepID=A0ABT2JVY6_9ACTN|nr:alpha/beta hydrolase family protein [Streptomyces gossypii]MCT2592067.1 alpha/beta hydrolase family protein [Streptomyces gossypii]
MVSYRTLRDLQPSRFEQAADGYHEVSSAAREAKDHLSHQIVAKAFEMSADGLLGEGATAARTRLTRLAENLHYTQVECGLLSAALNGLAAELRAAKTKLTTAEEEAENAGFQVDEKDGSVSWTSEKSPFTALRGVTGQDSWVPLAAPDSDRVKAQAFADRIGDALADATEADRRWAPKLRRLKAQNDLTVSSGDWSDVHGDQRAVQSIAGEYLDKGAIPKGNDPERNAEWWQSLSAQQKADYASLYPASIGSLDGLPADIRDEANRTVLAQKKGHYETALAAIPPKPTGLYAHPGGSQSRDWREQQDARRAWEEKYGDKKARLESALRGMDAIENRFARTGQDGLPEAYLLGFDVEGEGRGRVIIANGNPDTADHTAVYVPGTGAGLGNIHGDINRGETLWRSSDALAPDSDVSTITWLDYRPPEDVPHAGSGSYAAAGGPRLNDFLQSTATAQGGADASHTTVVGHSYGTTTVGEGSKQGKLAADDIVAVASPGMQVPHSEALDTGSEHTWTMTARDDDLVGLGGRLSGLGEGGVIPSDERFGAQRMQTDTLGHSGYWDSGSTSLENQSNVIVGEYGRVVRGD